jgi:O-antigen/teichoic acid export membrane protein
MASVALAYLMFVVLARTMTKDNFGQFAFAFSLATFIAVVAALGQPILVLRLIPVYQDENRPSLLKGLVRDSWLTVLFGGLISAGLMVIGSSVWAAVEGTNVTYLFWAALLMIAMAIARHQAYSMRGFGNIVLALAPRDIIWRVMVIVCAIVIAYRDSMIPTSKAINICTLTLTIVLIMQLFAHPVTHPRTLVQSGLETDREFWTRESKGLWAVTIAQAAGPNLSVVILGLILSPEETGPFFAALRTATLLTLPLTAGAIVGAPMISRHYNAGQTGEMQKILRYLVIGITVPVLVGLLLILLFGEMILGLFSPEFVSARAALTVIALGTLVNALSGPTGFIMNMTGHHRQYFVIMTATQLAALLILPVAAYYFGMLGAAATVAAGMVSWNFWVWWWARKNLSVDPTFYGVVEWLVSRNKTTVSPDEKA